MKLGDNIRYLRMDKGYSRKQFADMLGYRSATTVDKWERAIIIPPVPLIIRIADMFEVSVERLLLYDLSSDKKGYDESTCLTPKEIDLLKAYADSSPEIKNIVDVALGIENKAAGKQNKKSG